MSRSLVSYFEAITIALAGTGGANTQDAVASADNAAERNFRAVIERTLEAAAEEMRGDTWGDPAEPWDDPDATDDYEAWPTDATLETRRELGRLYDRYDRRLAKLEAQLDRRLRKAERTFAHETRRQHRPWKIEKRRVKYEERVDRAYAKYEDKVDEENRRFAANRDRMLSRQYTG